MNFSHSSIIGLTFLVLLMFISCQQDAPSDKIQNETPSTAPTPPPAAKGKLFKKLDSSVTGIKTKNEVRESDGLNYFNYEYIYNGGGVAIGDINNDGLVDLFFTVNMKFNKLYLNKGNLQFEDISASSGIRTKQDWCTGVTMADVNNDGWLDIYVSRSGWFPDPDQRRNLLFINNGDMTFTDQAAAYGVDDPGYTTQVSFFDFDRDNDLIMMDGRIFLSPMTMRLPITIIETKEMEHLKM